MSEKDRDNETTSDMSRRAFVTTTVAGAIAFDLPFRSQTGLHLSELHAPPPAFALDEATIDGLQSKMKSGAETARSLTKKYLARIDAIDQRGPAINSVIELNPDALTIAGRVDRKSVV